MRITPIAESRPRTTLVGTKDLMKPACNSPSVTCIMPAITTATRSVSNEPSAAISTTTTAVSPAAGPETVTCAPLSHPTTTPATIPATTPAMSGALDASAMPRHNGSATRNTTSPASRSAAACSRAKGERGGRSVAGGGITLEVFIVFMEFLPG